MKSNITMGLAQTEEQRRGIESDARAMRKAILYGQRDSSLINRCFRVAEYHGLSSEETYVLIAYFALCQVDEMWERQLQLSMLDIRQPMEPPK